MLVSNPDIELLLTLSEYFLEFRRDLGPCPPISNTLHLSPYGASLFGLSFTGSFAVIGIPEIPSLLNPERNLFDILERARPNRITTIRDQPGFYLNILPALASKDSESYAIWFECRDIRIANILKKGKAALVPTRNGTYNPDIDDRRIRLSVQENEKLFWERG